MTAIDLYSGVGGWHLGLKASGVQLEGSYEWWSLANAANGLNFGCTPGVTDIRSLRHEDLPTPGSIDFVVGSPPCTQFSFANRGGSGDLADGLVDIRKFLEIVRYLRPRAWAMENIPRVARILEQELSTSGSLHEFAHLVRHILVVSTDEFGVPQVRRRMVAGDFDAELLLSYRKVCPRVTLGDVINALAKRTVVDPCWGIEIEADQITDHAFEQPLSAEEARMNRAAKEHHPVYNRMAFPDSLTRPSRTVTATCTRVSRESIVVEAEHGYRRLTIRERAMLQSFPITFQFSSGTYNDRAKMIGNAIPPVLTYYVGQALLGTSLARLVTVPHLGYVHAPTSAGTTCKPECTARKYSSKRSFRSAIPGLRLHSGVRFELANHFEHGKPEWEVSFFYGSSKNIMRGSLEADVIQSRMRDMKLPDLVSSARRALDWMQQEQCGAFGFRLQNAWIGKSDQFGPFELLDRLGEAVAALLTQLDESDAYRGVACLEQLFPGLNRAKAVKNWKAIVVGACVASVANQNLGVTRVYAAPCSPAQAMLAFEELFGCERWADSERGEVSG